MAEDLVSLHIAQETKISNAPKANDIMLGFNELSLTPFGKSISIISGAQGYVIRSGMLGILGPSRSGKSVLLRALCGRESDLSINGKMYLEGKDVSELPRLAIGYVPTEDILIGELTVRETFRYSAALRLTDPPEDIERQVDDLIKGLGLAKVGDNVVGTVLKRGLSGGEKRRTSVGVEMIARPSVIFLDEPTSGLDAAAAYQVIQTIQTICRQSQGRVSVIMTLQQPNARILELLDHLLLLGRGSQVYFGAMNQSVNYFASLGHPCPPNTTPTDHFLRLTESAHGAELVPAYKSHPICREATEAISGCSSCPAPVIRQQTSFGQQFSTLAKRFFQIGYRDVTVYWLQFFLSTMYAFMIGVFFWQLPKRIDARLNDVCNGLVWLVLPDTYMHVFKMYYLMVMKQRFHHERANGSYDVLPWALADTLVTSFYTLITFSPGIMMAYFMQGMPNAAAGYVFINLFVTALVALGMMELVAQFFSDMSTSSIVGQGLFVVLTGFTGGSFIRWEKVPRYWEWLSELSVYTWSSRGLLIEVHKHVSYKCGAAVDIATRSCSYAGLSFPCSAAFDSATSTCEVSGQDFLRLQKGVSATDSWFQFGILIVFFVGLRLVIFLFMCYPPSFIWCRIMRVRSSAAQPIEAVAQMAVPVREEEMKQVVVGAAAHSKSADLVWSNITLKLRTNDKVLVDGVSGVAQPGQVLAIMGPSGAGKTTFLNALSGRAPYARVTGSLRFGTEPMSKHDLYYVPQFDTLNPVLTVEETLYHTAALLSSRGADPARIDELLNILGLAGQRGWAVSKLSFGERKRLSIACGLIGRPNVLFLDEPTTGLDSNSALNVVQYLIKVTKRVGVVCLMTIHQPSSEIFQQLDRLLLLGEGQTAYFGPAADAQALFRQAGFPCPSDLNPADFFLDLVITSPPKAAQALGVPAPAATTWKQLYLSGANPFTEARAAEVMQEVWRLTLRELQYFWKEKGIYPFRLLELIFLAFFVGTLFLRLPLDVRDMNEISGAVFFSLWVLLFSVVAGVPVLCRDRITFENEHLNGVYGAGPYVVARLLAALPYHLLLGTVYMTMVFFLVGWQDRGSSWIYAVLINTALLVFMETVTYMVVEGLKVSMLSTTFSMIILGTLFLFPGFFIKVDDMVRPIFWTSYIVPSKYALEGQLINVFRGQSYDTGAGTAITGDYILDNFYSMSSDRDKWGDFGIVLLFVAGTRLMHYGMVRFNLRVFSKGKLSEE